MEFLSFTKMNRSASEFVICEDFVRLYQLKCEAPEVLQAKREHNPSGTNRKSAESVLSEFIKLKEFTPQNIRFKET